jgi:hypothetical protein
MGVRELSIIALNGKSYEGLLQLAPKNGMTGGRIYNAVIGACAEHARLRSF